MNPVVTVDAEAAAANEARNSVKPESRINVQVDSVIAFKARTLYACKLLNCRHSFRLAFSNLFPS